MVVPLARPPVASFSKQSYVFSIDKQSLNCDFRDQMTLLRHFDCLLMMDGLQLMMLYSEQHSCLEIVLPHQSIFSLSSFVQLRTGQVILIISHEVPFLQSFLPWLIYFSMGHFSFGMNIDYWSFVERPLTSDWTVVLFCPSYATQFQQPFRSCFSFARLTVFVKQHLPTDQRISILRALLAFLKGLLEDSSPPRLLLPLLSSFSR